MATTFQVKTSRPSKLKARKNKEYHKDYARFCLSVMDNALYDSFVNKCLVNWAFFKGGDGQWIFQEDVESFFLDESGDIRNRLKWTKNVIKPMVQQYVGNAIRLAYNADATCISDFVINKREEDIQKLRAYHAIADLGGDMGEMIRNNTMIEDTPAETEEMYYNTFVEEYERDINHLIDYISTEVNINELKVQITRNLAICGMGIYKGYEQGGNYVAESVNPLNFFWDISSVKPDLSDSEYMGEWYYMDSASIFERFQNLRADQRKDIENHGKDKSYSNLHKMVHGVQGQPGGKVPVYEVYWKDFEKKEYGWVEDEFGYPYYTMINDPESNYKDKDLIKPPTEKAKKRMKGKKKEIIYVDILRFCIFIPQEELSSSSGDIILDHGILEYQEKNLYDPANVKFPYKVYTWVYDRGEVLTPLDDVIDPQRFLNRTMSVIESQMANMRGTGTVLSKSAVDDRDGEADVLRNINSSKPIFVDTDRVGSVQNAVGTYGSNVGGNTLQMFQAINVIQQSIQEVTGVNESMTGTGQSQDALVGVVQAQIQRGSLVQEPFYWALTSILKQAYEHMATVGKAIYHENPRRLAIMVGDKGLENINISSDHLLQDYRIFIKRSEGEDAGVNAGNQLLFTLLQSGLIDQPIFSNLFNRATPDLIASELRRFNKMKQQAQNMTQKAQSVGQQAAEMEQAESNQVQEEQAKEAGMLMSEQQDKVHAQEMEKVNAKEQAKAEREKLKLDQREVESKRKAGNNEKTEPDMMDLI